MNNRFVFLFIVILSIPLVCSSEERRILIPEDVSEVLAPLAEKYPNLTLVTFSNREEALKKIGSVDAAVGVRVDAELIRAGKNLNWVQVPSAGVEKYVSIPEILEMDIVLTNFKIYQGPNIADHAMALLLFLTRNMAQFLHDMEDGNWGGDRHLPMIELHDRTMLIIGLGGIGTQLAERAFAHGMRVLAIDTKDIPLQRAVEYVGKPDELNVLLPEADVVVSCVPHTPRTEKMLGAKQFELMKQGVYIINVSRGKVVDTPALVDALNSGKVRGAGLDVTDPEPLPPEHPLRGMRNVIITPHVAALSVARWDRLHWLYKENVERFLEGRPLKNVVDKDRGY